MKVLSVNIAVPRPSRGKKVGVTGIDKRPVPGVVHVRAPGPKGTGAVGLAGDRVYDTANHGGDDQAVYAYAREELDGWQARLARPLPDGSFGENLTTVGLPVSDALVGERWLVGDDLVLEVSGPRIPCATFQHWLDRRGWVREFTLAALPGAYLRVVRPGGVCAGDPVTVVHRPAHAVSVALAFRALTREPELLPRLLAARDTLPSEDVELVHRRLAGRDAPRR